MRYPVLDGFRGVFLLLMTMTHASLMFGSWLYKSYHAFTWADSAHGFVFLSGLVIGIVYMRRMMRQGRAAMASALWHRWRMLWLYVVALTLFALLLAVSRGDTPGTEVIFSRFGEAPALFALSSVMMLTGIFDADVLQLYLVCMAFTPLALRLIRRGDTLVLVVMSGSLWVLAQTGLYDSILAGIGRATGLEAQGVRLRQHFSYPAWQAVYFGGLAIGANLALGRLDPLILRDRRWIPVVWVCLLGVVALALYRWLFMYGALPAPAGSKTAFSPHYMLSFLFLLILISWIMIAGPVSQSGAVRKGAALMRRIFGWRPFVFLGQHSLQVFAWHVVPIYLIACFLPWQEFGQWMRDTVVLACMASLVVPAWLHSLWLGRAREVKQVSEPLAGSTSKPAPVGPAGTICG